MIMKTLRYIALAALTLSFAACEQEDINPAVQGDPDAVKINATIGALQTRVAYGENGVTNFVNGDVIKVVNLMRTSKNEATYTTTDGTNWTTTDAMVWNSSSKNKFQAWYPVADYSSYDTFTIPTDQSDATKLASADWMTASTEEIDKPGNGVLDLNFQHRLAKVTVNLTFGSQYPKGYQYVSDFTFYTNEETQQAITPLANSETSYTAILRPGEYADESYFIYLMMDGIEEHDVLGKTTTAAINLEAGKHYTFTLKVGKDVVSIDEVTVADWNEEEIDGGMAEEVPPTIDATAMNTDELNAAVAELLASGVTDITIKMSADADMDMFTALRTALAESTAPDGSINLTISGAKTVPDEGFIDMLDYFENDDKNIAGDKLKSLTLTDVETIGEYAFSACTNLEAVNMPKVVTIGEYAFNEWKKGTKLTSLDLPNATTIGDCAFAYSSFLTSVNLPKVVTIGLQAFDNCDIRTLDLPEVTEIGGMAFVDNYNLVSCSAPKATKIGAYPWGNCSKLETLELTAAGDITISNNYFANTLTGQINLVLNKDKESQVTQNDDGTATWNIKDGYGNFYTFKSITFACSDGTTNHDYQYSDNGDGTHDVVCSKCGYVKVDNEKHTAVPDGYDCICGATVIAVIDGTLGGKTTATEDDVNALVEQLKAYVDNGITTIIVTGDFPAMYDSVMGTIPAYAEALYLLADGNNQSPYCGTIDLILPDATEIVDHAFDNAFALKSITLPKVTTVGDGAFYGCTYLRTMTFGSVVTTIIQSERVVFYYVGGEVGGCDLVLNCGQMNSTYIPDLTANTWYDGNNKYFKSITLTHTGECDECKANQ